MSRARRTPDDTTPPEADAGTIPAAMAPDRGHRLDPAAAQVLADTLTAAGQPVPAVAQAAIAAWAEPETPAAPAAADAEEG